jgi:hypothetical protein
MPILRGYWQKLQTWRTSEYITGSDRLRPHFGVLWFENPSTHTQIQGYHKLEVLEPSTLDFTLTITFHTHLSMRNRCHIYLSLCRVGEGIGVTL